MIAIKIAQKNIYEFFRNIKENLIVIVMPIIFIAIFGFIFNSGTDIIFNIAVVKDENPLYNQIVEQIKSIENADSKKVFTIKEFEKFDDAKASIENKTNVLVINHSANGGIIITGDNRNTIFSSAAGIVTDIASKFYQIDLSSIKIENIDIDSKYNRSGFDLLVPGLIVYGLLIYIPYNAALFSLITEKKQILRYFLSKASSKDIIFGYLISQSIFAVFQTILMFVVAMNFGFKTDANIFEVVVISIVANLFIIGISLLIGSYSKLSQNSSNIGSITSVVLGFLSGSFIIGIEQIMKIGEWGDRLISVNQIFPSTLATQAWTQILLYNKHLDSVVFELVGMAVIGLIVLIIGVWSYNKFQLSRVDLT